MCLSQLEQRKLSNLSLHSLLRQPPVTQAARSFVDRSNGDACCSALERAAGQGSQVRPPFGESSTRWALTMPSTFVCLSTCSRSAPAENERSVLVLDSRDNRLQSPYQGWLLDEILINANARINILSDRALVRSPSTGYHMNLFMLKTLDGFKLVLCGSMTSYGSVPCGKWDSHTGKVLSHEGFSAIPLASHAGRLSHLGGRQGEDRRSALCSFGTQGLSLRQRHDRSDQPRGRSPDVRPAGECFHPHLSW